jgi:hypothetical protein
MEYRGKVFNNLIRATNRMRIYCDSQFPLELELAELFCAFDEVRFHQLLLKANHHKDFLERASILERGIMKNEYGIWYPESFYVKERRFSNDSVRLTRRNLRRHKENLGRRESLRDREYDCSNLVNFIWTWLFGDRHRYSRSN